MNKEELAKYNKYIEIYSTYSKENLVKILVSMQIVKEDFQQALLDIKEYIESEEAFIDDDYEVLNKKHILDIVNKAIGGDE